MVEASDSHAALAVLLIDLDRMEQVNGALGHDLGDRVLREAAARMARALGPGVGLARFGADDFAALAAVKDLAGAAKLAGSVLEHCREPYLIDCVSVAVTASIGIGLYPLHAGDCRALLEHAERALYRAKIEGRDRYYPGNPTCCGGTGRRPRKARA